MHFFSCYRTCPDQPARRRQPAAAKNPGTRRFCLWKIGDIQKVGENNWDPAGGGHATKRNQTQIQFGYILPFTDEEDHRYPFLLSTRLKT